MKDKHRRSKHHSKKMIPLFQVSVRRLIRVDCDLHYVERLREKIITEKMKFFKKQLV